jgi:lysophospholipase L1-like esterase
MPHPDRLLLRARLALIGALLALAGVVGCGGVRSQAAVQRRPPDQALHPATAVSRGTHWVSTWGASPQGPTPSSISANGFLDQTVRNVVFTSVGGSMVRVRFTNVFGTRPLRISRATIALAGLGPRIEHHTITPLRFRGRDSILVPPGAEATSDPASFTVPPLQRLAVSIFLPLATGHATQHSDSRQRNYIAAGDHTGARGATAFTRTTESWYFIDSVDVLSPPSVPGTIVALGDSITDGVGSTVNANARWPNDLARRLSSGAGTTIGVVDEGIAGNRILNASISGGTAAVYRFKRDVLARAGVRAVIVLEGINDIAYSQATDPLTAPHTNVSAGQIIAGYRRIIALAHAAGVKIYGATLTPFRRSRHWTAAGEAKRATINRWITTSGAFDGVIDTAHAVAAPNNPQILNPAFDSGDHLHPNDAGGQAIANAVTLNLLRPANRSAFHAPTLAPTATRARHLAHAPDPDSRGYPRRASD